MLVLGESVEQSIVNCLLQRREESNLILEDLILMRVFNSCRLTLAIFQCTIAFGVVQFFGLYSFGVWNVRIAFGSITFGLFSFGVWLFNIFYFRGVGYLSSSGCYLYPFVQKERLLNL
jgi:hypothetical protein